MKTTTKILLTAFIFTLNSCYSVTEISTFNDLAETMEDGDIQIVSRDTTVYFVNNFTYSDSSIKIEGIKRKSDLQTEFNGDLYFKDIAYIQTASTTVLPILLS